MTGVYDAWCSLVDVHAPLISRVADKYQMPADRLLQSSLLCVALHDVGKLSRNFQAMMRAADDASLMKARRDNYRHEIACLPLISVAARALNLRSGPVPGEGRLELLAIAGHHRFLAVDHLFDEGRFKAALSWDWEWGDCRCNSRSAITAAYGLAHAMFHDRGWKLPSLNLSSDDWERRLTHAHEAEVNPPFDWLCRAKDAISTMEAARGGRLRDLFVLLKGLLMVADWMASGARGRADQLDASRGVVRGVGPDAVLGHLRRRIEQRREPRGTLKLPPFTGLNEVQQKCSAAEWHVLAIAPTGSGKTEAAWLWALHQVERGHARKILVLLPTMVTANSIHERLCDFFKDHDHDVGLVHSTADLVRQTAGDGEDEADRAELRSDLSETHLFRPVTVGTVDQLLVPLFHAGRWAMKTLAAADAAIVIDEVHAYEPHTLGLIVLMIRQLTALGARFMVMSATMPAGLRETIHEALSAGTAPAPAVTLVEDKELLGSARNEWTTCDVPLGERLVRAVGGRAVPSPDFDELWGKINDRGESLRILIVVNTVKRCQDLARALRRYNPVCYHSKFIFRDRRAKEQLINREPPRLLIATQVVEVSLDIDYDVLLTECAPIDALIQRAGRVNRARRPVLGRVIVHPHEEGSQYVYGQPADILEKTWELCRDIRQPPSESDLIRLVEEAYAGRLLSRIPEFTEIQTVTVGHQERLAGVLDAPRPEESEILKTRLGEYQQLSVIPYQFHARALRVAPRDRRLYELKVPAWYYRLHRVTDSGPSELPVCRMKYGPVYGARLLTPEDRVDTGSTIA